MDPHPDPSPLYEYQPIYPGEIRVVELLRAESVGGPLRCRLRRIKIPDSGGVWPRKAAYTALSYVWGRDVKPFSVQVCGRRNKRKPKTEPTQSLNLGKIPVTANLHNALRDLQNCQKLQPKVFWADQLCINQADEDEKSHQVSQMGRVFQAASQVVTYLGPEEPGDEEALRCAEQLYAFWGPRVRDMHEFQTIRMDEIYSSLNKYKSVDEIPMELRPPENLVDLENKMLQLRRILESSGWHKRLWLVQENVLNEQSCFLRGCHVVPWDCIGLLCTADFIGLLQPGLRYYFARDQVPFLRRLRAIAADKTQVQDELVNVVATQSTYRQCRDERDKIYAVMGLARDTKELGIEADYTKSAAQVFTNLAASHVENQIKKGREYVLRILSSVSRSRLPNSEGVLLPSWVPRYGDLGYGYPAKTALYHDFYNSTTRLSRNPKDCVQIDEENSALIVKGTQMLPLKRRLGQLPQLFLRHPLSRVAAGEFASTFSKVTHYLGGDDRIAAALCHLVLWDPTWPHGTDSDDRILKAAQAFRELERALVLVRDGDGQPADIFDNQTRFWLSASIPREARPSRAHYLIEDSDGLWARSLWITEDDRLCLAPDRAVPGDIPVVLFGGLWIYFLRPAVEDTFEFLGTGYLHGAMMGEVFETEGWEQSVKTFKIV